MYSALTCTPCCRMAQFAPSLRLRQASPVREAADSATEDDGGRFRASGLLDLWCDCKPRQMSRSRLRLPSATLNRVGDWQLLEPLTRPPVQEISTDRISSANAIYFTGPAPTMESSQSLTGPNVIGPPAARQPLSSKYTFSSDAALMYADSGNTGTSDVPGPLGYNEAASSTQILGI